MRALGKLGQALSFDGTDDTVNAGNAASLDITTSITVSGWVKGSTQSGNMGILAKFRSEFNTRSWAIYSEGVTNKVTILLTQTGAYPANAKLYTSSIPVLDNTWHHISFTFTSNALKFYVDGVEDTGITKTTDNSVSSLYSTVENVHIGSFSSPIATQYFAGSLDDVRVYNRALTAAEVTSLYNLGR